MRVLFTIISLTLLATTSYAGNCGNGGGNGAAQCDAQGTNGLDGKDGANGLDGKDGTNGLDGKDGTNGLDGKDGTNGLDGKDGTNGLDGAPAPKTLSGLSLVAASSTFTGSGFGIGITDTTTGVEVSIAAGFEIDYNGRVVFGFTTDGDNTAQVSAGIGWSF